MALIRPFVPAKDFARSRALYEAIGFTPGHADADLAIYDHDGAGILLQNYYVKPWADNCMLQLFVRDLDGWWQRTADLVERFDVTPPIAPQLKPWGLRVGISSIRPVSCGRCPRKRTPRTEPRHGQARTALPPHHANRV